MFSFWAFTKITAYSCKHIYSLLKVRFFVQRQTEKKKETIHDQLMCDLLLLIQDRPGL